MGKLQGWQPQLDDDLKQRTDDSWYREKSSFDQKPDFPDRYELTQGFPFGVQDQAELDACTAFAVLSLAEYLVYNATKLIRQVYVDSSKDFLNSINPKIQLKQGSALFLYKKTLEISRKPPEVEASVTIGQTFDVLVRYGCPSETDFPFSEMSFSQTIPELVRQIAENRKEIYQLRFFSLETSNLEYSRENLMYSRELLLQRIKLFLQAGFPLVFGFRTSAQCVIQSRENGEENGQIPIVAEDESTNEVRHCVVAVGFDDNITIKNRAKNKTTKGALIIRNCWGKSWGKEGYGYLPYDYVLQNLAAEWWTSILQAWHQDNKAFKIMYNNNELFGKGPPFP